MDNRWKITIPVSRAYEEDRELYLEGEATGPERDTFGTEMSPEAIEDFSRQIQERVENGDPLPYIDAHAKDGVLSHLGWVVRANVDPNWHLNVRVRLDENNPAARYLHQQALNGKQYGMSVKGDSPLGAHQIRFEGGKPTVRFDKVVLKEISNTTRPSWVPSFGTVLARSVDGEIGVENMAEELTAGTPVEEIAPEAVLPEVAEVTEEIVEVQRTDDPTTEEVEVERARISKTDKAAIRTAYTDFTNKLTELGVFSDVEDPVETATPEPIIVENSDTGAADETDLVEIGHIKVERSIVDAITALVAAKVNEEVDPLVKTVERQAEYITKLESMPAGVLPAPVVREKFEDVMEVIRSADKEEVARAALNKYYEGR